MDDWELIEATFVAQYGIRLRESNLDWDEFCSLLSGVMPKTPLGQIVSIRSEEDTDTIKRFTPYQRQIRNEWRNRQAKLRTIEENEEMMKSLEEMFQKAFS